MSVKKRLERTSDGFQVDSTYEFTAPKYFDFAANMKESGSVVDDQSEPDHEWFDQHHSPAFTNQSQMTPKRPVKLYYSSTSSKKTSAGKKGATTSSDPVIPGTHSGKKKRSSSSTATSDWKEIPSPMTNGQGIELDNCDALLAELGLSPMPKGVFSKGSKKSPANKRKFSPVKKRTSPRKTPSKIVKKTSAKPSPLRHQVEVSNTQYGRNSLYRRLFQMKPKHAEAPAALHQQQANVKTSVVPAKLRVGADLLPAKSTKPLTVPHEFSFATDQRLKSGSRSNYSVQVTKPVVPRVSKPTVASRAVKPPTKPMSPKLTKRLIVTEERAKTVAEPVKAKPTIRPAALVKERPQVRKTVPRSPNFSTIRPRRPIDPAAVSASTSFLSTPFKARPAPKFGKPFEPVKPHRHTRPHDIKLPGDQINLAKRQKTEMERKEAERALANMTLQTPERKNVSTSQVNTPVRLFNPVPKPAAIVRERKVTMPRSPKFSTTSRVRNRQQLAQPS